MKRLTLDETWVLCLKMWKWIARQVRAAIKAGKTWSVIELKNEWLSNHGLACNNIEHDCFFCEYARKRNPYKEIRGAGCNLCPAKKIVKDFQCVDYLYDYENNPIAFYKRIFQLNKIRLAKKKK